MVASSREGVPETQDWESWQFENWFLSNPACLSLQCMGQWGVVRGTDRRAGECAGEQFLATSEKQVD